MAEDQRLVTVHLRGGPTDFPEELRRQQASPAQVRLKICHYGGYEHFERDPASDEPIYHWTGRTRIAE